MANADRMAALLCVVEAEGEVEILQAEITEVKSSSAATKSGGGCAACGLNGTCRIRDSYHYYLDLTDLEARGVVVLCHGFLMVPEMAPSGCD